MQYFSVALMEENGLGLDMNLMKLLKHDLQKVRQQLQQQAWKMAGRKFNLSSPVEIGKVSCKISFNQKLLTYEKISN